MTGPQGRDTADTVWQGRYLQVKKEGRWEYAERTGGIGAAVILALDDGHVLLIEQHRIPAGRRCLELPAGLIGDEGGSEDAAGTARRELEEETGYRAGQVEALGTFYASPGMTSEAFTIVRATGLERVGAGGGIEGEDIAVHRVPIAEVPAFVARKRADGLGIDAKLLILLGGGWLQG